LKKGTGGRREQGEEGNRELRNREQGEEGNREQGTGNREQGEEGNREQGTGNREQGEPTPGPSHRGDGKRERDSNIIKN